MQQSSVSLIRRLSVVLATAALLGPAVTQAASPKPFSATIGIAEVIQPNPTGPCPLVGDISGSGTASHLGKVTLTSRDCIIPMNQELTAFSFMSNQVVLTAANGDQIFATYSGTLINQGGIGAISGGYQIIGGTGRFANATGAGTVQGIENVSFTGPSKGQVQLNGTIAY
jgi:hypothetical protein